MFQIYSCLTTEHDLRLVLLAALVCVGSVFTGFVLFRRAQARLGKDQFPGPSCGQCYWLRNLVHAFHCDARL